MQRVDPPDPSFESLEPRQLLSTFTVTNANDTGGGSLRQAVGEANNAAGADVIEFDVSLDGAAIGLTSGGITIEGDLTIRGLGEDRLSISGQRISRAFLVGAGANVSMSDLTIKWGQQDNGLGGQVYVDSGASLTLTDVTLDDSQALWGGAIYNNFGSVSLTRCTVSEGKAFRHGGGIDSAGGPITVVDSTFVNNFASLNGGAIYSTNTATISGSTFTGNIARDNGGAILNGADLTLTNSTLSGNQADDAGGGIYNWYSLSLDVYNSTIVGNTSASTGGIANVGASATLTSTIVASNSGGNTSGTVNGSDNLIGGDPLLGPLADNGGPTLTREVLSGSGAIGQGSNPLGLTYDQRGAPYTRATSGLVDIGAFQRQPIVQIVDTVADVENGDYSAGDLSLREAVSRSNGDPAVYPTITFDPGLSGQTIILSGGSLEIRGGYEIDGAGASSLTIEAASGSRIFAVDDADSGTSLVVAIRNLSLTGGPAEYNGFDGGVVLNKEDLSFENVSITGSSTEGDGGAIYNDVSGSLLVASSILDGNAAAQHGANGGAIYNLGVLVVDSSTISNNQSLGGDDNAGGGIYNGVGATVTVVDSNIVYNWTVIAGGALANLGTATVRNSTLSDNTSFGGSGGAIDNFGGSVTVVASTLAGNFAGDSGGAIWTDATLSISNSTLSGNRANGWGGAIGMFDGVVTVYNSTVAFNGADEDDDGAGRGGAIDVGRRVGAGVLTTVSTIYAYNVVGGGASSDITLTAGTIAASSANNLVMDASTAGGLSNGVNGNLVGVDPIFGDLADNGGSTVTHALLRGSPAIDAGSNPTSLGTDQRGSARVSGDAPDIGAFESEANVPPTLTSLAGSSNQIVQGASFTLSANGAADSDGSVAWVSFYIDRNGDGVAQDSELLGVDSDGSNGYSLSLTTDQTAGFELGILTFLARAEDDDGDTSPLRSHDVTSVYSIGAISGGTSHATSTADGTHLQVVRNAAGDLIVFTGSGTEWTALRLNDHTSAPGVTGDPITWTDPNDGLAYVAAPSAGGFLLFRRAGEGTWSYRDIAGGAGNPSDAPVGTLVYFVTRPKTGSPLVFVAGINSAGEIVAYRQTSASSGSSQASWSLYNVSDDLTSQSMTTPAFTQMTSYVTSWNQWTLAGLDASGNVQGVWVNIATFSTWRVDNLSTITGAAPLVGELDVTLTTWGGIRFAGANASGRLVATWWNPSLGGGNWKQTDLTAAVPGNEAPALNGGQLTAWFTPTDRISYAGYDRNADVVSFYWQPGDGGSWSSDNLTASLPDRASRPVGTITTHVSADGRASIVGASAGGDVVRLWALNESSPFTLDNLSEIAVRA